MASSNYSLATKVKLPSGHLMPQIHLGLYQMSGRQAQKAVGDALSLGYRGFDSAQMYHNEAQTGSGIQAFLNNNQGGGGEQLRREDIFYTTKLNTLSVRSYEAARRSISASVRESGLEGGYVDLFLLHSPHGGPATRKALWTALEDAVLAGEVRSAGVSNYGVRHIEELMASNPRVKPSVNQIEVHPLNTREDIREACTRHGIVVQAYAPLAAATQMKNPTIVSIAKKYSVTPAQILVRWSLQHDLVPLPKSTKPERMRENADVGGFVISDQDMKTLDGLDEVLVTDWDPTEVP